MVNGRASGHASVKKAVKILVYTRKFWFIQEYFSRQTDLEMYGQIIMFQIIYLTLYYLFGFLRIEDSLAQMIFDFFDSSVDISFCEF